MGKRARAKNIRLSQSPAYQEIYAKATNSGFSNKQAKNMARMAGIKNVDFTPFQQQYLIDHPQFHNNVTEFEEEVEEYQGFIIDVDNEPKLLAKWAKSLVPFIFCNENLEKSKHSFHKAGNGHQFNKMLQFVNDNPRYLERIYNPLLEELDGANNEEAEAQRRAILEQGTEEVPKEATQELSKRNILGNA